MKYLLALCAALCASVAVAHDWYEVSCCSGYDCQQVEEATITIRPDGLLVTVDPSSHKMAFGPIEELIAYSDRRLRFSHDPNYHVCVSEYSQRILCVYYPGAF